VTLGPVDWDKERAATLLASSYWYCDLAAALQRQILDAGAIRCVRRSSPLYRIGDPVDGMYAALEGDLRVYVPGEDRKMMFVRPLGPGSWFGDIHLLDGNPCRTFEVRCCSPAALFFLSKQSFLAITDNSGDAYRAFVKLMCIHTMQAARTIIEGRAEAPARIARALARLARAHGTKFNGRIRIGIKISQEDLASLVGVSRQYLNTLIAEWAQEGLIEWKAKGHHVIDVERLKAKLSLMDHWIMDSPGWV